MLLGEHKQLVGEFAYQAKFSRKEDVHVKAKKLNEQFYISLQQDVQDWIALGTTKTVVLGDQWTVVTADGSRAAHWEHTVAATDDGPRILTIG